MKQIIKILIAYVVLHVACVICNHVYAQQVTVTVTDGTSNSQVRQNIQKDAGNLLTCFNQSVLEDGKKIKDKLKAEFNIKNKEGEDLMNSVMTLWKSSPISCCVSEVECIAIKQYGGRGYQLRDIPVMVLDPECNSEFQNLVMNFDNEGYLTGINMSLEKHNYRDVIMDNIPEEDLARRQVILDFVEIFRTAYNRKDLEYLKSVYSDDALIITGRVLKKKETDNAKIMSSLGNVQVEYQQQTKTEYINKLKKIFSHNNYINIKFDEVSVIKHPKRPNIYGVTLKQFWNTSTYSDVGWLFLMINFEDALNPSIEVRTWQPEVFDDGTRKRRRDEVFTLDSFNI